MPDIEAATARAPGIKTSKNSSAVRLAKACKASSQRLSHFQKERLNYLQEYVGPYYRLGDPTGTAQAMHQPMNSIYSLVAILVPNVITETFLSMVTTPIIDQRWFARLLEERLNLLFAEIQLAETMRQVVTDAMFTAGIVKIGRSGPVPYSGAADFEDWRHDPGELFVDPVSLDDYVLDPNAKVRQAASLEGNHYLMAQEDALNSELNTALVDRLKPSHYEASQPEGARGLSRDRSGPTYADGEFVPHLDLIDVYIPRDNAVRTIPGNPDETIDYLGDVEWEGPEGGPYDMLGFHYPPDNAIPVCPISVIYDLHMLNNELARKIKRQAEREKNIALFNAVQSADAEAVRTASDGHLLGVKDVNFIKELKMGGVDPKSYEAVKFFEEKQNQVAGNPNLMGGLEAESGTLGQEQMLFAQGAVRINDARAQVAKLGKRIAKKLAWYVWIDTHPAAARELPLRIPGGQELSVRWSETLREGNFLDYTFNIDIFSLRPDSPEQQYQRTMELVKDVAIPLAPHAAAQGVYLDVGELVKDLAAKRNLPEVDRWWKTGLPQLLPETPGAGAPNEVNTTNISLGAPRGRPARQERPTEAAPAEATT